MSLLVLQPHKFASAPLCCNMLHDMKNVKGVASNGRTLRQRFVNICLVVANSRLIGPDSLVSPFLRKKNRIEFYATTENRIPVVQSLVFDIYE